jgi:hypothetical protein
MNSEAQLEMVPCGGYRHVTMNRSKCEHHVDNCHARICVHVYVHISLYIYIYIYIFTQDATRTRTHTHIYIYIYIDRCIHMCQGGFVILPNTLFRFRDVSIKRSGGVCSLVPLFSQRVS